MKNQPSLFKPCPAIEAYKSRETTRLLQIEANNRAKTKVRTVNAFEVQMFEEIPLADGAQTRLF